LQSLLFNYPYNNAYNMKAKSIKGKSAAEIKSALQQSMADGFKPSLAIVFLSVNQDRNAICELLDEYKIDVCGTTTNGEFIDEDYQQGTIAILLLDISKEYYFIQFAELNGVDDRRITASLAKEAVSKFQNPAFLINASNLQTDIEEMLSGFTEVVDDNANIAGGMAGDDHSFTEQYVFTKGKASNRGVISLVLDQDKIIVKSRATHGWKAVGTEKTITESKGNRVYTIDHTPALDLCLKYSGLSIDHPKLEFELAMNFPLQLQRENGVSVMRPAFKISWEDHSFLTAGKLPTGTKVRFSLPPDFDVIEDVIEENKSMREEEMSEADALIVYNCGGRMISFGPLISEEIKGMQNVWNVPLAGMFSNAEIGKTKNGKVALHNLTTCWVVLKEK
jgi:hypothetical protein